MGYIEEKMKQAQDGFIQGCHEYLGIMNCRHCKYFNSERNECKVLRDGQELINEPLAEVHDYDVALEINKPDEFFCAMWEEK